MNLPIEQNPEKSHLHTSTLISLFEEKGYDCEKISRDKETIYVMKFDSSNDDSFEAKRKIAVH